MSKRVFSGLLAVLLALTVSVVVPTRDAQASRGPGRGGVRESKIEGTVTAVGANSVTIRSRQATVAVTVNSGTRVERNGRRVPLSAIRVGDRGEAEYNPQTFVASRVKVEGPR